MENEGHLPLSHRARIPLTCGQQPHEEQGSPDGCPQSHLKSSTCGSQRVHCLPPLCFCLSLGPSPYVSGFSYCLSSPILSPLSLFSSLPVSRESVSLSLSFPPLQSHTSSLLPPPALLASPHSRPLRAESSSECSGLPESRRVRRLMWSVAQRPRPCLPRLPSQVSSSRPLPSSLLPAQLRHEIPCQHMPGTFHGASPVPMTPRAWLGPGIRGSRSDPSGQLDPVWG